MDKDKLITLKYYDTVIKAEVDMEVLKENGIECTYSGATMVGVFPIFDDKERGIELLVFEKDKESAEHILNDYHSAELLAKDEN